ncbi:MAG TPA: transketolase C-terminal domain-containing protein [Pseudonocardiaceae bacterium]|jgi:transketolase|nr:transketolase C-terminal domain-containing protein [Pseudonocardiaceae bacterium]
MKSTRDWFGDALVDLAADHDDVVVVNCDLASATKTGKFKQRFPDRFFECGIAEANSIGIAAGLAQEGYRPFLASFGHFLTGKYLEIFQSVGLNNSGVVLVGTHAGLAIGKDGPTQMGLRDLALMRTLPNLGILHPADGTETRQMLDHVAGNHRPTYLRLCRQPQREVHESGYRFEFGAPDVVRRGRELVVFTMGGMVEVLLDALPDLAEEDIHPTVVNVSSLPVDRAAVHRLAAQHQRVFVVEDHFVTGGIADEIGRIVVEMDEPIRFGGWAVEDYGQAGSPADLYSRYELDPAGVVANIRKFLG